MALERVIVNLVLKSTENEEQNSLSKGVQGHQCFKILNSGSYVSFTQAF